MKCEWIDKDWIIEDSLILIQCYRRIRCNGKIYTLYLRWRTVDPWSFEIAEGDMVSQPGPYLVDLRRGEFKRILGVNEEGEFILEDIKWRFVSSDLFAKKGYFFKIDESQEAKKAAEKLFFEWIKEEVDKNGC